MNYPNFDSQNKSLLKKYLTPKVFDKLKNNRTALGYTLAQAINSGIENQDSNIGAYAGDEESYQVFGALFSPIIEDYHDFKKDDLHQSNLHIDDLNITNPDPEGEYILSTRIRVGRNLKDTALGALITREDRNQIEQDVLVALKNLKGHLAGQYYSLNKMTDSVRQELTNDHFLFKQGDRFLEAAGLNRDWPEGRGIFFNNAKDFLVWVNEEDQLRIISMQKGANIKEVFSRLLNALEQIEKELSFAFSDRLGYISSCPTNLGTAMRASVHISLPKLRKHKAQMEAIVKKHHLQIRGIHGEHSDSQGSIFDISNRRRLGISEVDAIMDLYNGVIDLIKAEEALK